MEGKIRPDIILMHVAHAEREMCVTSRAQRTFEDLKQKSLHSHFCLLAVAQPCARLSVMRYIFRSDIHLPRCVLLKTMFISEESLIFIREPSNSQPKCAALQMFSAGRAT